jgi:hypothetical protein
LQVLHDLVPDHTRNKASINRSCACHTVGGALSFGLYPMEPETLTTELASFSPLHAVDAPTISEGFLTWLQITPYNPRSPE